MLRSPMNYYSVTFLGTRIGREHGSPDRKYLRCSVPSFEHPLSSYTGPFVSERGLQTVKFQWVLDTSLSSFHGRAGLGNATGWIHFSSPHSIPWFYFVGA